MRKGQLIRLVLKAYTYHLNYIKENFQNSSLSEIVEYLEDHRIDGGVCFFIRFGNYAHVEFEGYANAGYSAKWVSKHCVGRSGTWGPYPIRANTFEEVIHNLQLRVDILEKELASGDKLHQRVTSKNYIIW